VDLTGKKLNDFYLFNKQIGEDIFSEIWSIKTMFAANNLYCFLFKKPINEFTLDYVPLLRDYVSQTFGLSHRHLVHALECESYLGHSYIITDAIPGFRLADYLLSRPSFQLIDSLGIIYEILHAIDYLHRRGLKQNLITPETVWIQPQAVFPDRIRLACFGYQYLIDDKILASQTQTQVFKTYIAPEARKGMASATNFKTDLYGAGVILFRLLSGELPERNNQHDNRPMPVKQVNSFLRDRGVPRDVRAIAVSLLKIRPGQRFGSAHKTIELIMDAIRRYAVVKNGEVDTRRYIDTMSQKNLDKDFENTNEKLLSETFGSRSNSVKTLEESGYSKNNEYFALLAQEYMKNLQTLKDQKITPIFAPAPVIHPVKIDSYWEDAGSAIPEIESETDSVESSELVQILETNELSAEEEKAEWLDDEDEDLEEIAVLEPIDKNKSWFEKFLFFLHRLLKLVKPDKQQLS